MENDPYRAPEYLAFQREEFSVRASRVLVSIGLSGPEELKGVSSKRLQELLDAIEDPHDRRHVDKQLKEHGIT